LAVIINITRSKPTGELGGKIRAGYEEYDTYYMDGIFNFGLGENVGRETVCGEARPK
jgi:iron complex outermembrane receptor protein